MNKKQIKAVEKATKNINNKEVTTAMLADYFNSQLKDLPADVKKSPVKRFADRKSAVRRVTEVVELIVIEYGSAPVIGEDVEPSKSAAAPKPEKAPKKTETEKPETGERRAANNSAGIAASWEKPEIRAKRAQRSAVEVDGVYYKSVPQAFRELEIPMAGCIAFRMHLKEVGETTVDGVHWKIVPLNYDK